MNLTLKVLPDALTVCKVESVSDLPLSESLYFIGKTQEELSLVCRTEITPKRTLAREDGWRGFSVAGVLDFALIGILSDISAVLKREGISIFALSTYNTDTVLVKEENLSCALNALEKEGCTVIYP